MSCWIRSLSHFFSSLVLRAFSSADIVIVAGGGRERLLWALKGTEEEGLGTRGSRGPMRIMYCSFRVVNVVPKRSASEMYLGRCGVGGVDVMAEAGVGVVE